MFNNELSVIELSVFEVLEGEDLDKPVNLKAIYGPDLIYDSKLDTSKFDGKICGCAILQDKSVFGKAMVLSGAFPSHGYLYSEFRYLRNNYNDENPDKPECPNINLSCAHGFVTDNGYFLSRSQALRLAVLNGQATPNETDTNLKSYHVKSWADNPSPVSEFVLKF